MANPILTKSTLLEVQGYKGGSFNGSYSDEHSVGGNDSVTDYDYNYLEYILSTFNIPSYFTNLEILELKKFSLTIETGEGQSVSCQMVPNSIGEYIQLFTLTPNSTKTIVLDSNCINLNKLNSILISAKKESAKVKINRITLSIEYRELESWELPESGKIKVPPQVPELEYYEGDISFDLFENYINIILKTDSRKITNEIEVYKYDSVGRVLIDTVSVNENDIRLRVEKYNLPTDTKLSFRARSRNYNGYSDWGEFSEFLTKTITPKVTIQSVTGSSAIQKENYIVVQNTVTFNFSVQVLTRMENIKFYLQQYIFGTWVRLQDTEISYKPGSTFSIDLDINNESYNGGLDIGEYRNYRIQLVRGNNCSYSNSVTLHYLDIPSFVYSIRNDYVRIPIFEDYYTLSSVTVDMENTSTVQLVLLTQDSDGNYTNRISIGSFTPVNGKCDITLQPRRLLYEQVLHYGESFKVLLIAKNSANLSSEKEMGTIFQMSEKLETPFFRWTDLYVPQENDSRNLYFQDIVSLKWDPISPVYFPQDIIEYKVYLQEKLVLTTGNTKATLTIPTTQDYDQITVTVSVSNGIDEFFGNNRSRKRATKPVVPSGTKNLNIYDVNSLTESITTILSNSPTIPLKVLLTWTNINSNNTTISDLQYILFIHNKTKSTLYGAVLNNRVYNSVKAINEAIVDLGAFEAQVGDTIRLIIIARDRFGLASGSITINGQSTLINGGAIDSPRDYTISQSIQEPLIFGADYFKNDIRECPAICAELQPSIRNDNGRNPLLVSKFFDNNGEYDYKFILTLDNIVMETIDKECDNIYPNGPSTGSEYKLMRFLGLSDDIDVDDVSDKYWHDLIITNQNTLIMVGNRGNDKILRSVDNGITWSPISGISDNTCLYSICQKDGILYAVGEKWTSVIENKNYYLDGDGNFSLQSDSDMLQITEGLNGNCLIFTPTIHNNTNVIAISEDDGLTWTETEISIFSHVRHINCNNNFLWALTGDGNGIFYKSEDGINWTTETMPGTMRCYTSTSDEDGNIVIVSIDKTDDQKFYWRRADSGDWYSIDCESGYWYNIDYNRISRKFAVCSLDGSIMSIKNVSNAIETTYPVAEIVFNTPQSQWYRIKCSSNGTLAIGGCGDKFRLAFCPHSDLNSWTLKKCSLRAFHNLTYINSVKGFLAMSYVGEEGGAAFINYLITSEGKKDIDINVRYYKDGIECYNLPEDILPQENGFNSIRISDSLIGKTEKDYNRSSIIYAENYMVVSQYIISLLSAYLNNHIPSEGQEIVNTLLRTTPQRGDFLGTYERDEETITTYLTSCKYCVDLLDTEIQKYVTGQIPSFLLPFYGLKSLLTYDGYNPGDVVYKDDTYPQSVLDNIDKFVLGLNSIINMLSKI